MPSFAPSAIITLAPVPDVDSYLVAPPMVFSSLPDQWNADPQNTLEGRYVPTESRADGHSDTLPLDNRLLEGNNPPETNTVGWVVETGDAWTDTWRPGMGQMRGLLFKDGAIGRELAVRLSERPKEDYRLLVYRGLPPTPTAQNDEDTSRPDKTYLYVTLAKGYRLALRSKRPIALERQFAANDWRPVATAKQLGHSNDYLRQNDFKLPVKVTFLGGNQIEVELGDGHYLRDKAPSAIEPEVRVEGRNGWAGAQYEPVRYQPLRVGGKNSVPATKERVASGASKAFVVGKGQFDRLEWEVQEEDGKLRWDTIAVNEDTSEDQSGAEKRTTLDTVSVVLPAEWTDNFFGYIDLGSPRYLQFSPIAVTETQILDPLRRTITSEAKVLAHNHHGEFTGTFGRMAAGLTASIGGPFFPRIRGIAGVGGYQFHRNDPHSTVEFTIRDRSVAMQKILGQEATFDGWSLWSVVRFLATCGNIHPRYQTFLPLYVPPGATAEDPYGPAGEDAPEWVYTLPRGTGLNARFKYPPDALCWDILQSLVVDFAELGGALPVPIGVGEGGAVFPRRAIPYYMGFDPLGYFHFEPIDFAQRPPKYFFTSTNFLQDIVVHQAADQMRSDVIFQGLDAQTNELLHNYKPLDGLTRYLLGYRDEWIERSARYASENYLKWATEAAAFQLSLPQQVFSITVPFAPDLYAGDVVAVFEEKALGGVVLGVVEQLQCVYGFPSNGGEVANTMVVTCRNVVNTL